MVDVAPGTRDLAVMEDHGPLAERREKVTGEAAFTFGTLRPRLGRLGVIGHELDDSSKPAPLSLDPLLSALMSLLVLLERRSARDSGRWNCHNRSGQHRRNIHGRGAVTDGAWSINLTVTAGCGSVPGAPPRLCPGHQRRSAGGTSRGVAESDQLGGHSSRIVAQSVPQNNEDFVIFCIGTAADL